MEFALPELLSRDDILRILNQRQLHIHNLNELTDDELLKVYKTFVMPLTKRQERSKKSQQNCSVSAKKNDDYENHCMQVEYFDSICDAMDIDFTCMDKYNAEHLRSSDRIDSPVGEKRRQRSSDEDILDMFESDYQCQLSTVTKRIRINSL